LLSKYRTHPTENIWKETSVEGKVMNQYILYIRSIPTGNGF
jgi:hypothetical protein